ncbi:MAG: sigma-70 family RNA polymerase sigma factor [Candidatus Hydrogenedentales bacterium]|jgi:RNA polymerase sigma-70 factor (ECF subfamily)
MSGLLSWRSDAHLVHSSLAGDKGAFERLVLRHLAAVEAVALAYTRNHADAQDVSQEAFLKAYQSLDTLRDTGKFGPWVTSIARNTGLRLARRRNREEPVSDELLQNLEAQPPDLERSELLQLLHRHVMKLPLETREVLLLHYYAGKRLREIADELDITRDAVAKRLQRGREAVSTTLFQTLGLQREGVKRNQAYAKRITLAVVAGGAAWEAGAVGSAPLFAAGMLLKPVVLASLITSVAFIGFLSYLGSSTPHVDGTAQQNAPDVPAVRQLSSVSTEQGRAEETAPPQEMSGPGSITVSVVSTAGKPAVAAEVSVELIDWPPFSYPPNEPKRKTVTVGDDGVARFEKLPLGLYGIVAHLDDTMWGDYTELSNRSVHSDSILHLSPGQPLDGVVVDNAGNPVPRAVVYPHSSPWITDVPWGVFATLRMEADEGGRIHHDCLPRMALRYCVVAEGHAATLTAQYMLDGRPIQLVVQKGGTISGRVVHDNSGQPAGNIALAIEGEAMIAPVQMESNENGEFTTPNLAAGSYRVVLKESGYTYTGPIAVEIIDGAAANSVEVRLQSGGTLTGCVRDSESGNGIAGATVTASAEGQPTRSSAPADESGAYVVFGLGSASYSVSAGAEGYLDGQGQQGIQVAPGGEVNDIDLTLTKGFLIRGRVLESDGRGATTAYIHSVTEGGERIRSNIASTDGKAGAFQILLPRDAEPIWLKAYSLHGSSEIAGPISVTEADSEGVVLRASIPRTAGIEGTVVNASGTPLPRIDVWAFLEGDPFFSTSSSSQGWTDQSGHFVLSGMQSGVFNVYPAYDYRGQYRGAESRIDLSDGHVERGVVLVFEKSSDVVIVVHVTGEGGRPLAGAEVNIQSPTFGQYATDANGEVRIIRPLSGEYLLKVTHPEYTTVYLEPLEEGKNTVTVAMQRCGALSGRVIDNDTGTPIEHFEVCLTAQDARDDGLRYKSFSNPDGRFELSRAESGSTVLQVRSKGYQTQLMDLVIAPKGKLEGVTVRLRPGGSVSGIVVLESGDPVPHATVLPVNQANKPLAQDVAAASTNEKGEFTLTGLPLEDLTLVVNPGGHPSARVTVTPSLETGTQVEITIPEGLTVEVPVTVNGSPQAQVLATLISRSESLRWDAETNSAGIAYFNGLRDDVYEVEVSMRVASSATSAVARKSMRIGAEGSPLHVEGLDLALGSGSIKGSIAADGQPIAGSIVIAQSATGDAVQQYMSYSQRDGSYWIEGLPSGAYALLAGNTWESLRNFGTVEVAENTSTQKDIALSGASS